MLKKKYAVVLHNKTLHAFFRKFSKILFSNLDGNFL